jgi:hypothetical protein
VTVLKAILVGHLCITLPALIFIACGYAVSTLVGSDKRTLLLGVTAGAAVGWLWWSLVVPRWRRWAHGRGVDPDALQKAAAATLLVWPRGWVFERTELPPRDKED